MIKLRDIFNNNEVLKPGVYIYRRPRNYRRFLVPIMVVLTLALLWMVTFDLHWFAQREGGATNTEGSLILNRKPVINQEKTQTMELNKPKITDKSKVVNDVREHNEPLDKVLQDYQQ